MKKVYVAPVLEIEVYQLDANIASHCGIVVQNGPALGSHDLCFDYGDPFGPNSSTADINGGPHNVQFYEDTNCDCYTSGGDYGYWTS